MPAANAPPKSGVVQITAVVPTASAASHALRATVTPVTRVRRPKQAHDASLDRAATRATSNVYADIRARAASAASTPSHPPNSASAAPRAASAHG